MSQGRSCLTSPSTSRNCPVKKCWAFGERSRCMSAFRRRSWPLIERAEQDTEDGNRTFENLRQRYQSTYFGNSVDDDASQS